MEIIGDYAFSSCSSLQNITIPISVASIGSNPFSACTSLQFIKVSAGNASYCSDANGVVYIKYFTLIICYPVGTQSATFKIPSTVTPIGNSHFLHVHH